MKRPIPTSARVQSKMLFILSLFLLLGSLAFAQMADIHPRYVTPGGYFDTVFDRFGKKYSLGEISIPANAPKRSTHVSDAPGVPLPESPTTSLYSACTPGYFRIYLEDSCGMDHYATDPVEAARLNVLCQVLTDISNLVPSPCTVTGQTVNIWITAGLTTGLGVATPFFNVPYSPTKSGIVDNTVWLTLNSGVDAFTNIAPPLSTSGGGSTGAGSAGTVFFHGSIAFNFTPAITWHTDLSTAPTAGESDLYTVALHEMMHVMGFCSLLTYQGVSLFGTYWQDFSRYDTHLENNAATDHLITTEAGCGLYQAAFNTAAGFTPPVSLLSPGGCGSFFSGGETDFTNCSTAIKYVGGWSSPVPVYTPQCFEPGASLSHFEDECYVPSYFTLGATAGTATNNQYFVLSNASPDLGLGGYSPTTNPGVMKRYLTPEERQVLCDIGYEVNTTFGMPGIAGTYPLPSGPNLNYYDYGGTVCPGMQVVGFNDGIAAGSYTLHTTGGTPVNINAGTSGGSILDNDRVGGIPMTSATGGSFKCLEAVSGTGTVTVSTGTFSTVVTYTPGPGDMGVQLLRYIPVSATGVEGNITYIYVFVGDAGCIPTTCDLVSNGGFENVPALSFGYYLPGEHCWTSYGWVPMLLAADATGDYLNIPNSYWFVDAGPHPLSTPPNNHYVGLVEGFQGSGTWASSSIQELLSTPLDSGQQYTVSFWAILGGGGAGCCPEFLPTHLQFAVGNGYPLISTGGVVPTGFMPPGFASLGEFTITHPDYTWHSYSATFTYNGPPTTASALLVQPAPWDDDTTLVHVFVTWGEYIGLDDVSIVPVAAACPFSVAGPLSSCSAPFGLDTAASVCVPGGTFSWPTVPVVDSIATTTTSSVFNPADAYAASMATGAAGSVPVAYTYTVTGCVHTVFTEVLITSGALPAITGAALVCAGDMTTLSDPISGGAWSSNNTAIATVNATTGVATGVSAGVDTVIYAIGSGCSNNITITVNPLPATIIGTTSLCTGATTILSDPGAGGTWSSGNTAIAIVDPALGVVSTLSPGTDTFAYTIGTGCAASIAVTIDPLPGPVSGVTGICAGDTATLSDAITGGTWSISGSAAATIGPATGLVSALLPGTDTVTYTTGAGCTGSITITVNALPASITGVINICPGDTTTFIDTTSGGVWSSGNTAIAVIGTASGIIAGIDTGGATITYTSSDGCYTTMSVSVNTITGTITGATHVYAGSAMTLSDAIPGGVWSSSNTAKATVDSTTGVVTGLAVGATIITYTSATGCSDTMLVTVVHSTGLNSLTAGASMLSVIPNPNKGIFTLSGSLSESGISNQVRLEVLDLLGKTVYSDEATVAQGMINKKIMLGDNIPNGVYMLRVVNNSMSKVLRFTVER